MFCHRLPPAPLTGCGTGSHVDRAIRCHGYVTHVTHGRKLNATAGPYLAAPYSAIHHAKAWLDMRALALYATVPVLTACASLPSRLRPSQHAVESSCHCAAQARLDYTSPGRLPNSLGAPAWVPHRPAAAHWSCKPGLSKHAAQPTQDWLYPGLRAAEMHPTPLRAEGRARASYAAQGWGSAHASRHASPPRLPQLQGPAW